MNKETVCAIVLDYRAADKTQKCLLSLQNQGLNTVYVLDNSESEYHSTELHRIIRAIPIGAVDYRIEILSAGENLGFGKGINFVLRHDRRTESPHDYYLLLNNDAVAGPGLVTGMIAQFANDPDAALVAPRIVSSSPQRERGIWYHRYLGLLLANPGRFRFHYFTGCCLLFHRDLVDDHGLFDEAFFMYGEDVELGWRLTRQGKNMICAEDVLVEHEYGPSVDRTGLFYEYHMVRGHMLLSLKTCFHPTEIPLIIMTKYLALACRAVLRSLRHRTLTPVAGFFLSWIPLKTKQLELTP
jgi:GT2 family glycosyltransferase